MDGSVVLAIILVFAIFFIIAGYWLTKRRGQASITGPGGFGAGLSSAPKKNVISAEGGSASRNVQTITNDSGENVIETKDGGTADDNIQDA